MKCSEINIRDPFVLNENGKFYMYGSRAKNFAIKVGGFDVYTSTDLENFSEPICCFDSTEYNLNNGANWAPEVHKYKGAYYMFATFTQENGLRGTYILKADSPLGPFKPHSNGAVTPFEWECLDGTLYIDKTGTPYIVFCHEHTQIIDGTICFSKLSDDLSTAVEEPTTIFAASTCPFVTRSECCGTFITDGPFMYETKDGELLMLWSSDVNGKYAELLVKFNDKILNTNVSHLEPLTVDDGGHGMIFKDKDNIYFTFHTPNTQTLERPAFVKIKDMGSTIVIDN